MPFDELKGIQKENTFKRITQRNLIPKAVKLRNSEIYQLGPETIIIYDKFNGEVFKINQSETAGTVTFGDNAWINYIDGSASFSTLTAGTIISFPTVTEIWLASLIPQWTNSWTALNTYQNVGASMFSINWSDFTGWSVYLDIVGKTDAGTGYYQLYNATDSAAFANSEVSTASTTPINIRSGATTKPTGTKVCNIQHKIIGGDGVNQYVNTIMAKLIIRKT